MSKFISIDDIQNAFSRTTESSRVLLVNAFINECGEKANTVYSVLQELPLHLGFDSVLLHSDGGVKDFLIIIRLGEYQVILEQFQWNSEMPFDTPGEFVEWLNIQRKKVEATFILEWL